MREILFRGKRADNGEWVYGSLITERNMFDGNLMTMHIQDIEEPYDDNLIDDETVGQFTGLTDKNGTKIFEGDIIRDADGDVMIVKWLTEGATFVLEPKPYVSVHFYSTLPSEIEVIGNIHDNFELLNE